MSKAKSRAVRLKRLYNITPEEWQKILDYQKGKCAICQRPASDFKSLHVDHDHSKECQFVRGLLDWRCNDLLPCRKNLLFLLKRAVAYLENPPAIAALGEKRLCGKSLPKKKRGKK